MQSDLVQKGDLFWIFARTIPGEQHFVDAILIVAGKHFSGDHAPLMRAYSVSAARR